MCSVSGGWEEWDWKGWAGSDSFVFIFYGEIYNSLFLYKKHKTLMMLEITMFNSCITSRRINRNKIKNKVSKGKRKRIRKIGKQLRGKKRHEGKFVDENVLTPPLHQVPCMVGAPMEPAPVSLTQLCTMTDIEIARCSLFQVPWQLWLNSGHKETYEEK